MTRSAVVSMEDYYLDESDDQERQEHQRRHEQLWAIPADVILEILADHIRSCETSELRAYVMQTLTLAEPGRGWMAQPDEHRIAQQLQDVMNDAIDGQVAMRSAGAEAR